ncbi:MAG: TetR/AcrR family transcriptional regulator [Hyphomonas sp.]|nr:TetR/AcrR family transcriptional regulator [Hyphomonas sp.]
MTEKKRRNPKQDRAQATVEAILEAAFQILEADGLAKLTTSRIAERAGVSIGTLYQYFRDKDAILAAMGQRQSDEMREKITAIVLDASGRAGVRDIVRALMGGLQGSPETRMVLSDALFRSGGEGVVGRQHLTFLDSISGRRDFDFPLGKESAFILTHAVIYLLRAAAAEPELALDPAVLEDELVHLMESYIASLAARAAPGA